MALAIALPVAISLLPKDCADQKAGGQMTSQNNTAETVERGTWGGDHIRLEVTDSGAKVEYDCAHGTIDQEIVADAQGRFDVRGTQVREHGGPVRRGETADTHPARFSGTVEGNKMSLTVTETDTGTEIGTFTLGYGENGRIMKCR